MRYNSKAGFTDDGQDLLISYEFSNIFQWFNNYTPICHVREITG